MDKTIFTITCNTETGRRQLIEATFKELGWTKAEYTAELLNTLAMAIGTKVASITKSSEAREELLAELYELMKEVCFSTDEK